MDFSKKHEACIDKEIRETAQSSVVIKENARRYELINKGKWSITKFKVENCIAHKVGEKGCEALLLAIKGPAKKGFLIELKGKPVKEALEQIQSSLNLIKNDLTEVELNGRIVPTAYKRTKFVESLEKKVYNQFKSFKGNLIIKESLSDTI